MSGLGIAREVARELWASVLLPRQVHRVRGLPGVEWVRGPENFNEMFSPTSVTVRRLDEEFSIVGAPSAVLTLLCAIAGDAKVWPEGPTLLSVTRHYISLDENGVTRHEQQDPEMVLRNRHDYEYWRTNIDRDGEEGAPWEK